MAFNLITLPRACIPDKNCCSGDEIAIHGVVWYINHGAGNNKLLRT